MRSCDIVLASRRSPKVRALVRIPICFLVSLVISCPGLAYGQEIKELSAQMAEAIAKSGKKSVAVVDFTDLQGNVTELGRFLAEEISVGLTRTAKDFYVIDRTNLKVVLQEHRLASSGIIDPQTARKVGEITGVEALVTGTTTPFGDSVRLSVKILDATTARIIGGFTDDIPRTKAIEELLAKGIGSFNPGTTTQTVPLSPVSSAGATSPAHPSFETESYRIVVDSAQHKGNTLSLTLMFESLSDHNVNFSWDGYQTYLIDDNGEKWKLERNLSDVHLGSNYTVAEYNSYMAGLGRITLLPNTKLKATITFSAQGQASGTDFTLASVEEQPKHGRQILIRGLK